MGFATALQIAEVARLLAGIVLNIIEEHQLSHLRFCRRRHVPDTDIDSLIEICHLERGVRRPGLCRAITATDDEIFLVVHNRFNVK